MPRGVRKVITAAAEPVAETLNASKGGIVTIPGVQTKILTTLIIGSAPLIVHQFSQKARAMILAKHMGEATRGREPKDPVANFEAARHKMLNNEDGFPAGGLKAAIASGFGRDVGVFLKTAKGAIRVQPDCPATNLVRILTAAGQPTMREDRTKNETGVVDIRHRPEFWPWAMLLNIEFVPEVVPDQQVLQAIARAGFMQGIGEWRPSSPKSFSGSFGTWRLANMDEIEAYEGAALFEAETPVVVPARRRRRLTQDAF